MKEHLSCWTPVKTEHNDNFFKADVWGRSYEFDNSPFPTKITTQGESILYSPIKLIPHFSHIVGDWEDFSVMEASSEDEKAVFVTSQKVRNVIVNSTVTIECDGFVKIDLKLMNFWSFSQKSFPELTALYLDIPVKKEYASLMHYWPNDKQSIFPAGDIMNSGETFNAIFPFKPYLSLGNNEVGLGVFCGESTKNFELLDSDKCITVADLGKYVNIRINILETMPKAWCNSRDLWTKALPPLTYTFGFHATPVKPMRKGSETYRIYHLGKTEFIEKDGKVNTFFVDEMVKAGVKWCVLHERWTAIQNYGFPKNKKLTMDFIKACHEKGIKVMVYFGYEYSTLVPDWSEHADDYLIKTTDGNFTGGWQRVPHQRAFMVCYKGGYSDEMISRVCYVMDELGVDGIYTDGTYVPWECANTSHGCGYYDNNGKLCVTFPVLAVREHVKKLYEEVHKRGGIIDTHQSSCCIMPTLSFADSYYDGENIQGNLKKEDMSFLNMAAFRCEYMGSNLGIPDNFISYTDDERPIETLSALTLLHNVHSRPGGLHLEPLRDIEYVSAIWNIWDKYDLDNCKWHPYWNNELVTADGDDAYVSAYETKDGIVIVAADFKNKNLTINTDKKFAVDLLSNKEYKVENGKINVSSDKATLNILLLNG